MNAIAPTRFEIRPSYRPCFDECTDDCSDDHPSPNLDLVLQCQHGGMMLTVPNADIDSIEKRRNVFNQFMARWRYYKDCGCDVAALLARYLTAPTPDATA